MEKIGEQLDNKEFEINLEEHPDASEEQEDYLYDLEYSLAEVLRRLEHFAGDSATMEHWASCARGTGSG